MGGRERGRVAGGVAIWLLVVAALLPVAILVVVGHVTLRLWRCVARLWRPTTRKTRRGEVVQIVQIVQMEQLILAAPAIQN